MKSRVFESLSLVYANLRSILQVMSEESGARLAVTLSAEENFDEGILILSGVENFIERYGIKDVETLPSDSEWTKVRFRLFGISFAGYLEGEDNAAVQE